MSKFPYKFKVDDIARLDDRARRQPGGWMLRCPVHDDRQASLSVREGDNGYALFKCFTGCSQEAIAAAFESRGVRNEWDADRDREPKTYKSKRVAKVIHNAIIGWGGEYLADHVRYEYDDGSKSFETVAPDGGKLQAKLADLLYGLELVKEFPEKPVIVCEGEKAADALRAIGVSVACGTLGSSIVPSTTLLERFRDREVVLWPDNDQGGQRQMDTWRKGLTGIARKITVVDWKEAPEKADAADWTPGKTLDDLGDLVLSSPSWESPEYPESVSMLWESLDAALLIIDRYASGDQSYVIPTGIRSVDRAIRGGLEPGEVYLLGAPTGGGKTTIMQDFAERIARRGPVLFVTPEMTLASMALRAIVRESGARFEDAAAWQEDDMRRRTLDQLIAAYGRIMRDKLPILILDKPDVSMIDVEEAARKIRGLKAVLIDYAQQVADVTGRTPRYLQVGEVATRSTVIAKSLGVPVILASQVNKTRAEERDDSGQRRSKLIYSFRETAMLEHKASVTLIFDRAKERNPEEQEPDEIEAVLRCLKNRHGWMFSDVSMLWDRPRFSVRETSTAGPSRGPLPFSQDAGFAVRDPSGPQLQLPRDISPEVIDSERVGDGG